MKIPCKNCITLSMCLSGINSKEQIESYICEKLLYCSILKQYLKSESTKDSTFRCSIMEFNNICNYLCVKKGYPIRKKKNSEKKFIKAYFS